MPREPYAAFLRGVSPMNAKMPELRRAFEAAGFTGVRTVLSSGNVVFAARTGSARAHEERATAAMERHLPRAFSLIIRPIVELRRLLASDPFRRFQLPPGAKRVVTFLREARAEAVLPVEADGARILLVQDRTALSAYVPSPRGPAFMALIERTFGKDVTTRTWETVRKVVEASEAEGEAGGRRRSTAAPRPPSPPSPRSSRRGARRARRPARRGARPPR